MAGPRARAKLMSDYMFMLENHLSAEQNRAVAEVQAAGGLANVNVFLTGGAMRDMLGGFQVRDLDFSVEGNGLKVAKTVAERTGAAIVSMDEHRRAAELVLPGGITAQIAMCREEKYSRPGARPQITPATIQEDLRGRDFTINAIALSLNPASRGLLLDPTNGLADLEQRELRAISPYAFYNDPSRLLRLIRFRVRLGFNVSERTRMQFDNARESALVQSIPPRVRYEELKRIVEEPNPSEIVSMLDQEGLLLLFSPGLAGAKLNPAALARLEKAMRLMPPGREGRLNSLAVFLYILAEKLSSKEKAALARGMEMTKAEVDVWQKLDVRARKLDQALRSARLRKPSQIYHVLSRAEANEVLFLFCYSQSRLVQERIRNYVQKYAPAAQGIGSAELAVIRAEPGTPKYEKARDALIAAHLDRRPRNPSPPVVPVETGARGRRGAEFSR